MLRVIGLASWLAAASWGAELPAEARALLDKSCVGCHQGAKAPAGLDLKALEFRLEDVHTFGRWVRAHDAVRAGAMPPGGGLKAPERAALLKGLAGPMVAHELQRTAREGRAVLRRLNRYEYENTVRDLLGAPWLELKDSLPEDGMVQRFNKSGQALDVSHVQMARCMETAEQALRAARASAKEPETTKRFYARDQRTFLNRMRYSSFNTHPERAFIPVLGFEAQPLVLAEKAPLSDPKTRELEAFVTPAGTYTGNNYHWDQYKAPVGGKYRLRFSTYSIWIHTVLGTEGRKDRRPWWHPNREKTSRGRTTEPVSIYAMSPGGEKRLLGSFDVGPEPGEQELEVALMAGEQIMPDAARLFRSRPGFTGSPEASEAGMPGVAYRWMEVTGPVGREASPWLAAPVSAGEAERLLRQFVAAAYRRPAAEAEIARYLGIMQGRMAKKPDFGEALLAGYVAVLCSPGFLYLEEKPGALDGYSLASRLSYFLWNAAPDAELRRLAKSGALKQPAVLRAQANRLLDDGRSGDFTKAFLDYWLDLRKVGETTPDQTLYPDYYLDDLLIESATKETQLYFRHLLTKNLPASHIVDSNFTMVNAHLARHYGLPGVAGVAMRQVSLPAGSVRGGILTQASVLKVTANGTTTSPVLRGVWMLERILGDPPPPPPPGVPAVEPDTRGATTIRQQLDKHRAVAACASCHAKIDPPGFALESFDVLGAYRERYRSTEAGEAVQGIGKNGFDYAFRLSQPVDASGELATKEKFRDVVELKRLLLKDERQLARNMVGQWIAYGTGAPVGFGDRAEVERILDAAKRDRYGLRSLLLEIVASKVFTEK